MEDVTPKDGTTIAFDRLGEGAPVILVSGGSVDRWSNAPLAELLASDFTLFNYDRRGRGPSGDTPPYAVEREIEDIDAVIGAAGGSAFLYGSSYCAALALDAAASGLSITKLAMWEPPYFLDPNARPPANTAELYNEMIADGRRGDAVEYFMSKVVGMRPSSSPRPEASRGGWPPRLWRTRWPTTPPSWPTTPCRSIGLQGSRCPPS